MKRLAAPLLGIALVTSACGGDSDTATNDSSATTAAVSDTQAPSDNGSGGSGESALSFTAQGLDGSEFNGADIKGDVVLWFWAPW
jgi:hypothetical protein